MSFANYGFLLACLLFVFILSIRGLDLSRWQGLLCLFGCVVLVYVLATWLGAIRASQLAPHRIVTSINGREISSFWTTNPMHVDFVGFQSIDGRRSEVLETNYYWHVWSIFQAPSRKPLPSEL